MRYFAFRRLSFHATLASLSLTVTVILCPLLLVDLFFLAPAQHAMMWIAAVEAGGRLHNAKFYE